MELTVQPHIRIHGDPSLPTIIYCPGMHGDWTLAAALREELAGAVCFVEFCYPLQHISLPEYASQIIESLSRAGIASGWLLGESFGSQVVWAILEKLYISEPKSGPRFQPCGVILAGGFVRYPFPFAVRWVAARHRRMRMKNIERTVGTYARWVKTMRRDSKTTQAAMDEFLANRLRPGDRDIIEGRYDLIAANDPRDIARKTTLPVYQLTGFWDVIVPWPPVWWWLRRNCPGYRGCRIIWGAEHNVLGIQPQESARQLLEWIGATQKLRTKSK